MTVPSEQSREPHGAIPGPDPGACPDCGGWRKAGMTHDCEVERKRQDDFAQSVADSIAHLSSLPNLKPEDPTP